jgi:hypothetical protein
MIEMIQTDYSFAVKLALCNSLRRIAEPGEVGGKVLFIFNYNLPLLSESQGDSLLTTTLGS